MRKNSKRPNGVITAVFGISCGSTGIYLVVYTDEVKFGEYVGAGEGNRESLYVRDGYLSGTEAWLSAR